MDIYIDEDFIDENGVDLVLLIAHQMGHVIGLRHTDWYEQGEVEADHIENTPYTDSESVMNAVTCGKTRNGFTGGDITAIQGMIGL